MADRSFLRRQSRSLFSFIGQIVIVVGIAFYMFYNFIDFAQLQAIASNVQWLWLIPISAITALIRWFVAIQTRLGLQHHEIFLEMWFVMRTQLKASFLSFLIVGDIFGAGVTWYAFSRENNKRAQVASLLLYLRLLNLITIVPFGLLGLYLYKELSNLVRLVFLLVSILNLIALLPLSIPWVAKRGTRFVLHWTRILPWYRARQAIDNVLRAIEHCAEMSSLEIMKAVGLSLLTHLLGILNIAFICEMVDIHPGFVTIVIIRSILQVITSLPLVMGGTGLREISIVSLLTTLHGVEPNRSLAFSLLILSTTIAFTVLPGLILHLPFKKIT